VTWTADVIVVGAGVVGAACARRLAERGLSVRVLEAASAPAAGSTGRSAAGVRVQFSEDVNILLSAASIEEYREMPESGYRPQGYLILVPPEAWAAHARGLERQQARGLDVRSLSHEEAGEIVPFTPDGIAGITFGARDGSVDPHGITLAFLRDARANGARVHLDSPVTAIEMEGGAWRVTAGGSVFEAPVVVNAAGAWAGGVARLAGLDVPVGPARRMVFVTGPLAWRHAYPMTFDLSSGFWFRSEGERLIFGLSNPRDVGFREGIDWDWLEPTLEAGLARFPWLADATLDRAACWWGYYEVTPDHAPILGRMPGVSGWVNACGFSGHGVMQAAAVGRVIAQEVVGEAPLVNIDPLRYERFLGGTGRREERLIV